MGFPELSVLVFSVAVSIPESADFALLSAGSDTLILLTFFAVMTTCPLSPGAAVLSPNVRAGSESVVIEVLVLESSGDELLVHPVRKTRMPTVLVSNARRFMLVNQKNVVRAFCRLRLSTVVVWLGSNCWFQPVDFRVGIVSCHRLAGFTRALSLRSG